MPNMKMGFRLEFKTNKVSEKKGEVFIFSVISDTKWWGDETTSMDINKALDALGDVDEITVRINSPGGAVNEAIAIKTALEKHKARKIVDIEGSCCSAATLISSGKGFHVRIAKGSEYMIHRCSWAVRGKAQDMLAAYNSMVNTDNDIADIYAERCGKTREEMLKLMDVTTWYNAEQAIAAGFADEMIEAAEGEEEIAACAMTEEVYKIMCAMYDHVPEMNIVSNEKTAVAAGNSSENTGDTPKDKGGIHMELKDATAEVIQQENPAAAQAIADKAANDAVTAERERIAKIRKLTRKGAKWEAMRDKAIEDGTSPEAYLESVIAEEEKAGAAFLEQRRDETQDADKVGAGDTGDLDNSKEAEDTAAREIADMAKEMTADTLDMA